jgi:hypothetical protein
VDCDLVVYSGEGQEHFGKIMKKYLKLTNAKKYAEGDVTKAGNTKVGYVEQAVSLMVLSKHFEDAVPARANQKARRIVSEGIKGRVLTKTE